MVVLIKTYSRQNHNKTKIITASPDKTNNDKLAYLYQELDKAKVSVQLPTASGERNLDVNLIISYQRQKISRA